MATTKFTQRVHAGTTEHTGELSSPAANDVLSLEFDNAVTIDDMVVEISGTINYDINLVYPVSGMTLPIETGITGNFLLNEFGFNNYEKLWFSVPQWTKLQIVINSASSASLKFCAIAKSLDQ